MSTGRAWFCILTITGHDREGRPVSSSRRGTWFVKGTATIDAIFDQVLKDTMKGSPIVGDHVVTFWHATPVDPDAGSHS